MKDSRFCYCGIIIKKNELKYWLSDDASIVTCQCWFPGMKVNSNGIYQRYSSIHQSTAQYSIFNYLKTTFFHYEYFMWGTGMRKLRWKNWKFYRKFHWMSSWSSDRVHYFTAFSINNSFLMDDNSMHYSIQNTIVNGKNSIFPPSGKKNKTHKEF